VAEAERTGGSGGSTIVKQPENSNTPTPDVAAQVAAPEKERATRRKLGLEVIVPVALLSGYVVGTLIRVVLLQPEMSLADYDRIKNGMSQTQVTAILGRPPNVDCMPTGQWDGDEGTIRVGFNDSGRVIWKCYFPAKEIPRRGLLEKLGDVLKRLWNLLFY
jgi:hypothetical protein